MAELIEIGEQQERVILFAASTNDSDDTEESVEELKELVKTAGAETVGTVIQNRENIHPGTYLGKGKIQELKEMVWESGATGDVCDDELSTAQQIPCRPSCRTQKFSVETRRRNRHEGAW